MGETSQWLGQRREEQQRKKKKRKDKQTGTQTDILVPEEDQLHRDTTNHTRTVPYPGQYWQILHHAYKLDRPYLGLMQTQVPPALNGDPC